jgi:hypothetical protein
MNKRVPDDSIFELQRELCFLDGGGYLVQPSWRVPLFFEDSPICTKHREQACSASCPLRKFVPIEFSNEAAPCRHIPFHEAGETLHSLYSTATNEEIEAAVRRWLTSAIETESSHSPGNTAAAHAA